MEMFLRFLAMLLNLLGLILRPFIVYWTGAKRDKLPPIKNEILNLAAVDLIVKIRSRELKSEEIVRAYIERIKEVNPYLNAVVEDRFVEAIKDAKRADRMVETTPATQIEAIFKRYPLLGLPFTVKESCGLKGMSYVVGNIHRVGMKSQENGEVVENLRAAGAIPLLVSANPEFCLSWETNTITNGRCNNPYNTRCTPGGSSGGEGALNGAGASLFGVGSDIAGSIRVPGLFSGVFGHKPTGGLLSTKGHFPNSPDERFGTYLQLGPLTRFARDLPLLMHVMAGDNSKKMEFSNSIPTKDIRIFYMLDNGTTFTHTPVTFDIKLSILRAVEHFKRNGLRTEETKVKGLANAIEMSLAALTSLKDVPSILVHPKDTQIRSNLYSEMLKYINGVPDYSFASLALEVFLDNNGFMPKSSTAYWLEQVEELKQEMKDLLGNDGVLFFPTFHAQALPHNTTVPNISGVGFVAIVNAIGFPSTHVPMGVDSKGLPFGFQVIAAPYQDKLCLQIAGELEAAFGGWVAPKAKAE